MAITVTITKPNVFDEYGRLLPIGTAYAPFNDDYARNLVSTLRATDTNNVLGYGLPNLSNNAMTWAGLPSASLYNGFVVRVLDAGGGPLNRGGGNFFVSNGLRWKPYNGNIILDTIDTSNAGTANTSEQQLNPNAVVIPANSTVGGVIGANDRIRVTICGSKSAGADTATLRLRFGVGAGTGASKGLTDSLLATITIPPTSLTFNFQFIFKRVDATTFQREGITDTTVMFGTGTVTFPTATTLASSLDTTPQFFGITQQMTGGTEFVTIQDYILEHLPTDSA